MKKLASQKWKYKMIIIKHFLRLKYCLPGTSSNNQASPKKCKSPKNVNRGKEGSNLGQNAR